ncbi:hypothetical protein ACU20_08140 [Actinobaculum suis]|nr:hypothetical protein ACU20_08140 [Actinobaculum suis]
MFMRIAKKICAALAAATIAVPVGATAAFAAPEQSGETTAGGADNTASTWEGEYSATTNPPFMGSNTPYHQDGTNAELEAAPEGFAPSYTVAFARHGSRTSSGDYHMNNIVLMLNEAEEAGKLTPAGAELRTFITETMQPASAKIGAGNLTTLGKQEFTDWTNRAVERNAELFSQAPAGAQIAVETSGHRRAIATADAAIEALQASPYAALAPNTATVNDKVLRYQNNGAGDAWYDERETYLDSDPNYLEVKNLPNEGYPELEKAARDVLRPYIGDWADTTGTDSPDAPERNYLAGYCGGIARDIFETRSINEALKLDGSSAYPDVDLAGMREIQRCTAIDEWYKRGQGFSDQEVTYNHGRPALAKMFESVDTGGQDTVATFMFSHNEILTPLNALLAIPEIGADEQAIPGGPLFNYADYSWNQAESDPMGGNIEWNVFENNDGVKLVRMQHNERPVSFGHDCQPINPGSSFYLYNEVKACLPDVGQDKAAAATQAQADREALLAAGVIAAAGQETGGEAGVVAENTGAESQQAGEASTGNGTSRFAMAILPDTQFYSRYTAETSDGDVYTPLYNSRPYETQTQWIADNAAEYGIEFTMHLGDIVDRVNKPGEWEVASHAMAILEDARQPYSILAGNHDVGRTAEEEGLASEYSTYTHWFSPERAAYNSTFVERDPQTGAHEAHLVDVAGTQFLVLNFSWEADDTAIAWGQKVLDEHPGVPTILNSHQLINVGSDGNTAIPTAFGEKLWEKLIRKNDQIFLTFNGHHHGATKWERTNDAGHPVYQVLMDYQMAYMGGNGYMGLVEFDLDAGKITQTSFSPWVMQKPQETLSGEDIAKLTGENQTFTIDFNFRERFPELKIGTEPTVTPSGTEKLNTWLATYEEPEQTSLVAPQNAEDFPHVATTSAHWRPEMVDGKLQFTDISGNGNDMAYHDNVLGGTAELQTGEKASHAYSAAENSVLFTPATREIFDYFETAANAPINKEEFRDGYTVEAMFALSPGSVNETQTILNRHVDALQENDGSARLSISNLNEVQWKSAGADDVEGWSNWSGEIFKDNNFYHVAAVNDPADNSVKVYVNGNLILRNRTGENHNGISTGYPTKGEAPWRIGGGQNLDGTDRHGFWGAVSEIRVVAEPLDSSQWLTARAETAAAETTEESGATQEEVTTTETGVEGTEAGAEDAGQTGAEGTETGTETDTGTQTDQEAGTTQEEGEKSKGEETSTGEKSDESKSDEKKDGEKSGADKQTDAGQTGAEGTETGAEDADKPAVEKPVGEKPAGVWAVGNDARGVLYVNAWGQGKADRTVNYGNPNDEIIFGDWDGDGIDTPLVRRGNAFLGTNGFGGVAEFEFAYGNAGDEVLVGDWNGDGKDTVAVVRGNQVFVRNSLTSGVADAVYGYGNPADTLIAGDWNGDGKDTLAAVRGNIFYVQSKLEDTKAAFEFAYGNAGDRVIVGDWNGTGKDGVGVVRGNQFFLRNELVSGVADSVFAYGNAKDVSVVGDWDGDGIDTPAVDRR